MKLRQRSSTVVAIVATVMMLGVPVIAAADAVSDWNAIAVQATLTAARPGPTGFTDLATVHVAIHDAVQAIEGKFQPYYVEVRGASGSPSSAAAKAARDVLVSRFPAQAAALETIYQQYLLDHNLSGTDAGVAVGAAAASGIIALRGCDASFPQTPGTPFIGGTEPGMWRPTPPGNLAMAVPWLGSVVPFTLTRSSQFRAAPPPGMTTPEYTRDYDEVRSIGALNSSSRTAAQTDAAQFWAGNYVVIWNQFLRDIAATHIVDIAESARYFALAELATADAVISSWDSKNFYAFWRPVTAIREGENDGNPRTAGDAAWLPLITTPNYPDHTSGANNVTRAMTRTLELFFRTDRMTFSVATTNTGPTQQDVRTYTRFSDVAAEVVETRIHSGLHFRFADEAARQQGNDVAEWVYANFLRTAGDKYDRHPLPDGPYERRQ
jgi:hypothetical protein